MRKEGLLMGYIFIFMSLFFKLWNYINFKRLASAGINIASSSLEPAVWLKRKFNDYHTLNKPVNNTTAYVERVMSDFPRYREGITLLSGLSLTCFGAFYILSMIKPNTLEQICFFAIYFMWDRLFDTAPLRNKFISCAADYLDNTLKTRFCPTPQTRRADAAYADKSSLEAAAGIEATDKPHNKKMIDALKNTSFPDNASEPFEDVINEFL